MVEARFSRYERLDLGYAVFERGDRFVEHFYSDRWYNVFAVYARVGGRLKGWYCNVTRPAQIEDGHVRAVDLGLDVWVDPQGGALLLDEEEFAALPLEAEEVAQARAAVEEIRRLAREGKAPFER